MRDAGLQYSYSLAQYLVASMEQYAGGSLAAVAKQN